MQKNGRRATLVFSQIFTQRGSKSGGLGGETSQLGHGRRPREKRERNLFSHPIFECAAFNFLHLFSGKVPENKCKKLKAARVVSIQNAVNAKVSAPTAAPVQFGARSAPHCAPAAVWEARHIALLLQSGPLTLALNVF